MNVINEGALVSVIIPVYNVQDYLERCVQSVTKQKYRNLEIILVDDGSTDQSGHICDKLKQLDPRMHVIRKQNGGLSDARNVGLAAASGNYISFVDSDDWVEENMIELLLTELLSNKADIAIGRKYRVYPDGKRKIESYQRFPKKNVMSREEALDNLMSFCGYDMSVCDKLFARHVLNYIVFPYGKTCEDSYTTYRIFAKAGKVVYVDRGIYNYFYRENSISRGREVNETVIDAAEEQLQFINDNFPRLMPAAASFYESAVLSVYNEYIRRGMHWNTLKPYRKIARRYLPLALRSGCTSNIKKFQFFLFYSSMRMYRPVFLLIDKRRRRKYED